MPFRPCPSISAIETAILTEEGDVRVDGIARATPEIVARHRLQLAERRLRTAYRTRAVAVRAAQPLGLRLSADPIDVPEPLTRCVWCTHTIPCGTGAITIDTGVFHAQCATEWTHTEPEDERALEVPLYPRLENYACT